MKKKTIFFVPIILIFIIFLLYSCNENPVLQKIEGFDSARYNVVRKNVMYGKYKYIIDSNNIFIGDLYNFIYIKDTTYNYFTFGDDFICENIGGNDNEIYFVGGSFYNNSNNEKPRLKKWLGSGFEEIPITDTTDKNYYLKTAFISYNHGLFLGGIKGNVLKYYNGNFTKYKFDSAFYECQFFQDEQNNLYCWEYKDSLPSGNYFKEWQYFYKFINNSWEHIYTYINFTDSIGLNHKRLWPFQVGNEILAVGYDGIYKFDGISYIRIMEIENFQPLIGCGINGSGSNNLLITGFEVNHSVFFNWNGIKWSKECTLPYVDCYDIKYSKNCYIAVAYHPFWYSDFLIFKKK